MPLIYLALKPRIVPIGPSTNDLNWSMVHVSKSTCELKKAKVVYISHMYLQTYFKVSFAYPVCVAGARATKRLILLFNKFCFFAKA